MSKFHTLVVSDIKKETADSVSVAFEIPAELKSDFNYVAGQYLTLKFNLNGEELRRSYSLCSSPLVNEPLRVAVKMVEKGKVSTYMNQQLKVGDKVESMAPIGNFFTELKKENNKHYVGIAAGSGITPIFAIIKSMLVAEPNSKFSLVYSNKTSDSTIFLAELKSLEQSSNGRFKLISVYSRQATENPVYHGRLNKEKVAQLLNTENLKSANEFFICGPEEMILNASAALNDAGVAKDKIHFELFTTPVLMAEQPKTASASDFTGVAKVKVIMDGIETEFELDANGANLLDAAMDAGADAPFSCKGAVCCTCKAKVREGKAEMMMNYALTDKEVAEGYILTCQAHPRSASLVVDYDVA